MKREQPEKHVTVLRQFVGQRMYEIYEVVGTPFLCDGQIFEAHGLAERCHVYDMLVDVAQSPIEKIMAAVLPFAVDEEFACVYAGARGEDDYAGRNVVEFCAQSPIGAYSCDFLATVFHEGKSTSLVIECDGHDYHERTKEQAGRDRKRDREMQAMGYRVLRFTGSQLWRDPEGVRKEIENHLSLAFESLGI